KAAGKTSPREVLERAKAEGVEVVDVRFVDLPGTWQHFSLPLGELEIDSFKDGLGFDGSSIRGFQSIDESDMLLMPDPDSATIDPVLSHKTLFLICDVIDPITREPYSRDARFIAKNAEEYLKRSGIADVSYWGPEAEFYLFNSIRFDQNAFSGYYYIDSEEGIWHSGRNSEPNRRFMPRQKEGVNLFADSSGYAGLSQTAVYYIGGLLKHAPALLALCAPTTNSYRRLVPGYEAPINLVYSKRNRSACVRIPMYTTNPKAKRVEFRSPDPAANPYLAFAACLMAGLDGIKNKVLPPEPVDKDIYEL